MDDPKNQAREDLKIIRRMMEETRQHAASTSGGILFYNWGIGGLLASIASQVMVTAGRADITWIVWTLYGIVCGVIHYVLIRRLAPPAMGTTFVGRLIGATWTATGVAMLLGVLVSIAAKAPTVITPIIAILIGTACFITAPLIEERILRMAAAVWWVGGVAMAFAPLRWTHIIYAILFIVGYLLPGYIFRLNEARTRTADAAAV